MEYSTVNNNNERETFLIYLITQTFNQSFLILNNLSLDSRLKRALLSNIRFLSTTKNKSFSISKKSTLHIQVKFPSDFS